MEMPRLRLIPFTVEHAAALERGRSHLASLLRAHVPEAWPHFPEAYVWRRAGMGEGDDDSSSALWGTYLFLLRDASALVGSGGYKGEPNAGLVEVGYEIAPEFQNQGFATEAMRGMIAHAFTSSEVQSVQAHTRAETDASTRVLEKVGMTFVETINSSDGDAVWRWRVARPDWVSLLDWST